MIQPGTTLGTFEITGLLGKGGMGEVYRAKDTRLGREVAIKVLPDDFAHDPERLSRFEREAQTLASLNHPNVATVHGFEHDKAQGLHFLVMEFIDGETLGQRITGKPLTITEALPLFIDIARGLDAAHEVGIVHRDMKPDNVKINEDGVVKILDFGIAKSTIESKSTDPGAPTTPMSPVAVTAEGTFMGTPVYMSPEQARGRSVDHRTDIWAFGCCLYEALTGDIPFEGDTIADTVGAIMEREPDWDKLPASTPESLRKLLTRSLEKNYRKRLSSLGDIAFALEDVLDNPTDSRSDLSPATPQQKGFPRWTTGIATLAIGLLVGAAAMMVARPATPIDDNTNVNQSNDFAMTGLDDTPSNVRPIRQYSITLPFTHPVSRNNYTNDYTPLDIAPNGVDLLYNAQTENGRIFMQRSLQSLEARPIPGTENSHYFNVSPSGEWAVMYKPGAYWKIPSEGGTAEKLLDATLVLNAFWEDDTHIIFSSTLPVSGLIRMDIETGEKETITELDRGAGELAHVVSQILPDQRTLFYMGISGPTGVPTMYVMSLDTMESKLIPGNGFHCTYVDSGHLLFAPKGRFMALPFDIATHEPTGSAKEVTPPYMAMPSSSPQSFTVTPDGDLIYVRDSTFNRNRRVLVWVEMDGTETIVEGPEMSYRSVSLSSSGSPLRILFIDELSRDMWIYDLDAARPPQQMTFDHKAWGSGFWFDGGKNYSYSGVDEEGRGSVYLRSADGLGTEQVLKRSSGDQWNLTTHSAEMDSNIFLGTALYNTGITRQVVKFESDDSSEATPIFDTVHGTSNPMLSPDNHWLAYQSDELGTNQIFVTSYPNLEGKWRVTSPDDPNLYDVHRWAPDGSAIYYRSESHIVKVPVDTNNGFQLGRPERLFNDIYINPMGTVPGFFDIHPDGDKFLFIKPVDDDTVNSSELIVIENWLETLRNPDLAGAIQ